MRSLLTSRFAAGLIAVPIFLCAVARADAQTAKEFYENTHQLRLIVGSSAGGGFDFMGRLVAKYMSKYLPGSPTIVAENMPGAGGEKAANYVYAVAPKDGSTFAILDRAVPTAPLLYNNITHGVYDAVKFGWLGSTTQEIGVGLVSSRSPAKTVEDFKRISITLGSDGPDVDPTMYARLMNALLGAKFKVITGYPGQTEYYLAMTKGETDGMFMSGWSGPNSVQVRQAYKQGKVSFFVQMAAQPTAEFGDTPTIMQLLHSEDDREMINILLSRLELGRPFLAPPGVPGDRLDLLRKAFKQAVDDPELKKTAAQANFPIAPIVGADAQKMIEQVYDTPRPVLQRIRQIVQQ